MCLLAIASGLRADLPLVVAANRDEWLARDATAMTVLEAGGPGVPRVLGGRDHAAGGTWMAVNDRGVVAALTNQPGGALGRRSRGALPLMLTAHDRAADAAAWFERHVRPSEYNPCWILVADREGVHYLDLTGEGPLSARRLEPSIVVLENRPLDEASPKAAAVRAAIEPWIANVEACELAGRLHRVLASHDVPAGAPEARAALSTPCVHAGVYGTRSSEIVLVAADTAKAPSVFFTDRSPCVSALEDASGLW